MKRQVKGNYSGRQDLRNYADALRRFRKFKVDLEEAEANGDIKSIKEFEQLADDVYWTNDIWEEWCGWFNRHSKRGKMGKVIIYTRI